MTGSERELTADETRGKTDNAKRNRDAGRLKAEPQDGIERLRQAADRQVGRHSAKIAVVLTQNALKGELASTKVLVGLAEKKKPEKKKRHGLSQAQLLMLQPPWEGDGGQGSGFRDQGSGFRDQGSGISEGVNK